MYKIYLKVFSFLAAVYLLICLLIYLNQEIFIFQPLKTNKEAKYRYNNNFKEINLKTSDGFLINNLYFEVKSPKGVIYFLHGNAGNLSTWGSIASFYQNLGYNVFITDYRGYGKSEGEIKNQTQLFSDALLGYNFLTKKFNENKIIIVGYSIGTGIASYIASTKNPKALILQAPYYSIKTEMKSRFPFIPTFLLKYPLENNLYVSKTKCPVYIFHGDKDYVISHTNSSKLKPLLKEKDTVIFLKNQNHIGISENIDYKKQVQILIK